MTTQRTFVAPRDRVESELTRIWERILGVRPISLTDNFFELGGHSLLAVSLFAQIEKSFGKSLPLATLFRGPTIEQLAAILQQRCCNRLRRLRWCRFSRTAPGRRSSSCMPRVAMSSSTTRWLGVWEPISRSTRCSRTC